MFLIHNVSSGSSSLVAGIIPASVQPYHCAEQETTMRPGLLKYTVGIEVVSSNKISCRSLRFQPYLENDVVRLQLDPVSGAAHVVPLAFKLFCHNALLLQKMCRHILCRM